VEAFAWCVGQKKRANPVEVPENIPRKSSQERGRCPRKGKESKIAGTKSLGDANRKERSNPYPLGKKAHKRYREDKGDSVGGAVVGILCEAREGERRICSLATVEECQRGRHPGNKPKYF